MVVVVVVSDGPFPRGCQQRALAACTLRLPWRDHFGGVRTR